MKPNQNTRSGVASFADNGNTIYSLRLKAQQFNIKGSKSRRYNLGSPIADK